jgi:hypothetical protein
VSECVKQQTPVVHCWRRCGCVLPVRVLRSVRMPVRAMHDVTRV